MKYNFQKKVQPAGSNTGSQSTVEAKKKLEAEIMAIGPMINQYRIDFQRFFAGDLQRPPDELRERISKEIRRLQLSKLVTSANTFQLNSLEAQFNSQVELFGRRLREREQVGGRRGGAVKPQHDPQAGVVFGQDGAVEALYKGLYMRGGQANASIDLERFRGHLSKQAAAIQAKTGAANIQFRIAEEDGKLKLKARPIKG